VKGSVLIGHTKKVKQDEHNDENVLKHVNHEDGSHVYNGIITVANKVEWKGEVLDLVLRKFENILDQRIYLEIKVSNRHQYRAKGWDISWCLNDKNGKMQDKL
jgi:hypothetical protein